MKLKVALFLAPGNSVATGQHPDTEIFCRVGRCQLHVCKPLRSHHFCVFIVLIGNFGGVPVTHPFVLCT